MTKYVIISAISGFVIGTLVMLWLNKPIAYTLSHDGCITVKGAKGINGGGDGGDAIICGDGYAKGGAGGDGSK